MHALGLYLHIPFCSSICNYCNFNRGLFEAALKTRYVEALEAEIRQMLANLKKLADDAGIPDEGFQVDVGDEVKKVVDKALEGKNIP